MNNGDNGNILVINQGFLQWTRIILLKMEMHNNPLGDIRRISKIMNKKTKIYFGPPLSILTENENNTMEISGKINRTAERYLAIIRHHSVELTKPERDCLVKICDFGFMSPHEIMELADEVKDAEFEVEGLDRKALIKKLESASLADLVATIEELGF